MKHEKQLLAVGLLLCLNTAIASSTLTYGLTSPNLGNEFSSGINFLQSSSWSISQFDPSLGTLTGVNISVTGVGLGVGVEFPYASTYTAQGTFSDNVSFSLTDSSGNYIVAPSYLTISTQGQLFNSPNRTAPYTWGRNFFNQFQAHYSPVDLSPWQGTGSYNPGWTATFSHNPASFIGTQGVTGQHLNLTSSVLNAGADNFFGSITYTYDAIANTNPPPTSPVPVPGAVWLFGSVLAGLLGFQRRWNVERLR